jgi:hypothetical protein
MCKADGRFFCSRRFTGTGGPDDIRAGGGGDRIFALGDNDVVLGAKGADTSDGVQETTATSSGLAGARTP